MSTKFNHYRFSISWTRILPNGSAVNPRGIDYYSKLIDKLIENKIEPVIFKSNACSEIHLIFTPRNSLQIVTIFHWDIPRWLQDLGGIANPIFIDHFKIFSDVLFHNFGSRVNKWITMNEPFNFCTIGYGQGGWAPGIRSAGVGEYLCVHHMLLAHAQAYRLYKKKYFHSQKGLIGITLDSRYYYAKDETVKKDDLHRAQTYRLGWYAQPIFGKEGGYPQIMIDEIDKRSRIEGRNFSRLPKFNDDEIELLKGSADFMGLNYYTSRLLSIEKNEINPQESPAWYKDSNDLISIDQNWKKGGSEWLYSVPEGLRDLLNWIKNEYDNPQVFITENGWSDDGRLEDDGRIEYLRSHMQAVLDALIIDKCNVFGYTAWSFLDSFEWDRGFLEKFGLFSVNFSSPNRRRTAKKSAYWMKNVIEKRSLEVY